MRYFIISALMAMPLFGFSPAIECENALELSAFWQGRSFVNRSSDALGISTNTFRFVSSGKSAVYETSGVIGGSGNSGRNEFDVVSASSSQLVLKYTSASDRDMAPYIVGKTETVALNASDRSMTISGKLYR